MKRRHILGSSSLSVPVPLLYTISLFLSPVTSIRPHERIVRLLQSFISFIELSTVFSPEKIANAMADGNPPTPIPPASTQQHPQAVNTVNNHTTIIFPDTSVQHAPLMEVDNSPDDRSRRATSVLSMDDIEAAQALEGLRSGIFLSHIQRYYVLC